MSRFQPNALTDAQVAQAQQLRSEGWTAGAIAGQFGVNAQMVRAALNGKRVSHAEIRRRFEAGETDEEMGAACGRSAHSIYMIRRSLGLRRPDMRTSEAQEVAAEAEVVVTSREELWATALAGRRFESFTLRPDAATRAIRPEPALHGQSSMAYA